MSRIPGAAECAVVSKDARNTRYDPTMKVPVARRTPPSRNAKASAAAVSTRYHTAISTEWTDTGPSPVMLAGSSRPAVTLSALLFSVVLSMAAPRPRTARYTAATAFGRLVTAASTTPPVTICGTPK